MLQVTLLILQVANFMGGCRGVFTPLQLQVANSVGVAEQKTW